MLKGIDISNNNGIIDFKKVKASGIQIVYIKASEGDNYKDKNLEENYKNAKLAGLKVGFYHFFHVEKDAEAQAALFYNSIKDKTADCIYMCDVELAESFKSVYITTVVKNFIEKIKKLTGKDCGVYTYTAFAVSYLNKELASYKLWIANYCGENKTPGCFPWTSYVGHQYSEKGSVSGINGAADMDNFQESILLAAKQPPLDVKKLQTVLQKLGHYKGKIDGIFGTLTEQAVKDFENRNGLTVTGKVEGATLQKLIHFGL